MHKFLSGIPRGFFILFLPFFFFLSKIADDLVREVRWGRDDLEGDGNCGGFFWLTYSVGIGFL